MPFLEDRDTGRHDPEILGSNDKHPARMAGAGRCVARQRIVERGTWGLGVNRVPGFQSGVEVTQGPASELGRVTIEAVEESRGRGQR